MGQIVQKDPKARVTFELVLRELRAQNFAVLSTVDDAGRPHSAGVNYGVSPPGQALTLYVMTRRHLQKARDIAQNPDVALVVPLRRRLLWFLPPATIQVRGRAQVLDGNDSAGTEVFRRFWMGRRILEAYQQSRRRDETRVCFLKITPDPVIHTYMVGFSAWGLRNRMEAGAGKVVVPEKYRSATTPPVAQGQPASPLLREVSVCDR
jgi:general stress protein 26